MICIERPLYHLCASLGIQVNNLVGHGNTHMRNISFGILDCERENNSGIDIVPGDIVIYFFSEFNFLF